MDIGIDTKANRELYAEMHKDETVSGLTYDAFLRSQHVQKVATDRAGYESRRIYLRHTNLN